MGNMEKAASLLENKMGCLEFKNYFLETFDKKILDHLQITSYGFRSFVNLVSLRQIMTIC